MNVLERIRRTYRNLSRPKAVSDYYPDLKNREHISVGYSADVSTMAIENYVGHGMLYRSYVWVHKAVALISDSIAPLPVQVVDAQNKPLPGHDVSMALARANDSMDAAKMWAVLTVYKLLGGEWFLEVVPDRKGRPAELWPRRPDQVLIIADDARPAYPHPFGYQLLGTGIDDTIPPEYMIQDSFINPLSVWRGLSPIAAVLSGIKLDILNQAYSLNFVQGNARPDYAVEVTEALTPDERARAEAQISQKYSGPDGWHRPMLLENGQKIHVLSFPPKDMEGLEQRKVSRDEVAAIFNVPDILMGFGNDSYDTEEKREAAEAALWTMTLTPLIFRRDTVLTWHFQRTRHLKPGERVATDLSGVSVLQEDLLPKLDAAGKLFGMGVPYNMIESRLKLGTGPIPFGDVGYMPMNLLPIAQIAEPPPLSVAPVAPTPTEQPEDTPPTPERPAEAPAAQPALAASIERRVAPVLKLEKAAGHNGAIVALWIPAPEAVHLISVALQADPPLPVLESAESLHVTLCYLGRAADIAAYRERIELAIATIARRMPVLEGIVGGLIRFTQTGEGTHAICAAFDCPALPRWRQAIVEALLLLDVPVVENHGFTPHITLAYVPPEQPTPAIPLDLIGPIRIDAVTLAWGGEHTILPCGGQPEQRAAKKSTKASRQTAQRTARALQRIRRSIASEMEQDIQAYFDTLAADVIGRAEKDAPEAVTKRSTYPTVADLLTRTDEDALRERFRTWSVRISEASWETWNNALDVDIGFERTDPAVVAAMKQSGARVTDIMDYTRDALRQVLEYGTEQGWSIDQLVNGDGDNAGLRHVIEETYKNRARAIARTELGYAQASASLERFRQMDVERVLILDNGQDDPDDECAQLNGTVQTLEWYQENLIGHTNCTRAAGPYYD